jgi:hypothetical protein
MDHAGNLLKSRVFRLSPRWGAGSARSVRATGLPCSRPIWTSKSPPDAELAAQSLDACQSTVFKPLVFNFGTTPSNERIEHVVRIGVRTFMAAYGVRNQESGISDHR